ncbi:ATP-binding protein, partial [Amycolatopsis bartoniae]
APPPADPEAERKAGHDKLLADLGAFSDGERAARQDQRQDQRDTDADEDKQQ